MKKKRIILPGLVILSLLCCAATLVGYLSYSSRQQQALEDRPLVLIHTPLNHQQVPLGKGVMTHATARATSGVSRIELWADGKFVAVQESPTEGGVSPLVLSSAWKPHTPGMHILVVRAISSSGVAGQATITIEATEDEAKEEGGEVVAEAPQAEEPADGAPSEEGASEEPPDGTPPGDASSEEEPADGVPSEDETPPDGETPEAPPRDTPPGDAPSGEEPAGGTPSEDGAPSGDEAPSGEEPAGDETPGEDGSDGGDGDDGDGDGGGETPTEPPPGVGDPPNPFPLPPGVPLNNIPIQLDDIMPPIPQERKVLRVELLALETTGDYESVHCYVGLAERPVRWYPDTDGNQETDEYFAPLGDGAWGIATHLAGDNALLIPWDSDQPLHIVVHCTGITGGGRESVGLGRIEANIDSTMWDNTQSVRSNGGRGGFTLEYLVSEYDGPLVAIPGEIVTDPSIPAPTNLTFAWRGDDYLQWDYDPGEESIAGFRIYLNGTLQWVEPADRQVTLLPPQWKHPPCGDVYEFTVTAYRNTSFESPPSEPVSAITDPASGDSCGRSVVVTFETLNTSNIGVDGDYDPGDQGPAYGDFYANEERVNFDGEDAGWGMRHNIEYSIEWLTTTYGDGPPRLVVDVPEGEESVQVGFSITDIDTGYVDGKKNEDDLVCSGQMSVFAGNMYSGVVETGDPNDALPDRCRVAFTLEPVSSDPVAHPGGALPLPYLRVKRISVEEASDQMLIHVRNEGTADWPSRDLKVALERRSGAHIGLYTWPGFTLRAGEETILQDPSLTPEHPLDVCVTLDPTNEVLEDGEDSPAFIEPYRYCEDLPNLVIENVYYDALLESLQVRVRNRSLTPVDERDLYVQVTLDDGNDLLGAPVPLSDTTVEHWPQVTFEIPGIGPEQRARMWDGYTVTLDPQDSIAETDEEDNAYVVRHGERLRVRWRRVTYPYYPFISGSEGTQHWTVNVHVGAKSLDPESNPYRWEIGARGVTDWTVGPFDNDWASRLDVDTRWLLDEVDTVDVDIFGDESLLIGAGGEMRYGAVTRSLGHNFVALFPNDDWGAAEITTESDQCGYHRDDREGNLILSVHPEDERYDYIPSWQVVYRVCILR